jgi:hypothetical protein
VELVGIRHEHSMDHSHRLYCRCPRQLPIIVSIDGLASAPSGLDSAEETPSRAPHTSALERIADELTEAEHVADVPEADILAAVSHCSVPAETCESNVRFGINSLVTSAVGQRDKP